MWLFCAGMMRSGSTLQYQIAKTLVEGAGRGVGVGSCEPGRFRELLDRYDDPEPVYVVKCHRYVPTARARLRRGEARALYIYRDLRDVVVSMMHKENRTFRQLADAGFVRQLLEDDAIWSTQPNTLVSVYEEVSADLRSEVERIARFLDIDAGEAELDRIAEEHSLARQKRRLERFDFGKAGVAEGQTNLVDPSTLLHHNHLRSGESGQWADELEAAEVAEIERVAGGWLLEHGYPVGGGAVESRGAGRVRRAVQRRGAAAERARVDLRFRLAPGARAVKRALARPLRWISDALTSVRLALALGRPLYAMLRRTPGPAPLRLADVERVLVVRVDEIGDTVLTTPMLRELRRNLPEADITLVVNPGVKNLVERCPHVDRVLTYDWVVSGLFGRLKRHIRALRLARRELWPRRLDLALLPRWPRDRYNASFLTYFSGATHRVGYSETVTERKRRLDAGADRLFTRTLTTNGPAHEVERSLDVLRAVGGDVRETCLELWLDEADEDRARRLLADDGASGRPLVAFGIGAGSQRRVWPIPRYAEVARALEARHGARVVALGSPGDRVRGESFSRQAGPDALNLVGRTTLREAAAVLRRCDLYVGNDTGVMHLAAAAGVPVVEISCHPRTGSPQHDHSPVRFGPWGVEHRVLRPDAPLDPCTDGCTGRIAHCITRVPVEPVLDTVIALLNEGASDRRPVPSPSSAPAPRR